MVEGGAQVLASFLAAASSDVETGLLKPVVDMLVIAIGHSFGGQHATPYPLDQVRLKFRELAAN